MSGGQIASFAPCMAIVGGSGKVVDAAIADDSDGIDSGILESMGINGGNLDEYQDDNCIEVGGDSRDRKDLYRPKQYSSLVL